MLSLRTLKSLVLVSLLWTLPARATSHTVLLTVQSDTRNGPLDIADLGRQFRTNQLTQEVGYRTEGLWETVNTQASIFFTAPDYSSVTVRTREGKEEPLSNLVRRRTEISSDLGVDWAKGADSVTVGWRGNLNESPFRYNLFRAGYTRSFFSQTTSLGLSAAYLSQNQPLSFFVDPEFRTGQRPTHINGFETALTYDQVLTENWKMRNRLVLGQRVEERPANLTLSTRHGYGLTDRLFADLQLNGTQEFRGSSLKNERGYFTSYGVRAGLSHEALYDLILAVSYGLVIEQEGDPRSGRLIEVASDQYGLGLTYTFSGIELQTQGNYVVTNTGINNVIFSGGVLWRI